MPTDAVAIVDSRNMFHQAEGAVGVGACPTVPGVRSALGRYGFNVTAVHVGLALARPSDQQALAKPHADNDAYRLQVLADGGDVLLGELHKKPGGSVEEKMVDSACCVRITRYVDEIAHKRSNADAILVLSQDIDLQPAVDYAVSMGVAIFVAAYDVIQHRRHPYLLLGPSAYAEMSQHAGIVSGHELREAMAKALVDCAPLVWTVSGSPSSPFLVHRPSGLRGKPAPGTVLPARGAKVSLYPLDLEWTPGCRPVLICGTALPNVAGWSTATVLRRTAPMTIEVKRVSGTTARLAFPLGGVVPGDSVLVHHGSGRALAGVPSQSPARSFDPDRVEVVRVIAALPRGGALAASSRGTRGLLNTNQIVAAGQRLPAMMVDLKPKGPVWTAIGTPLP